MNVASDPPPLVVDTFAGPGGDPNECWTGLGWDNGNGYRFTRIEGKKRYIHRLAYEQFRGPIPVGLYIDHLCRNRACWNPAHLEAVTNEENILRGESPPARNARKETCGVCGSEYRVTASERRCSECKQRARVARGEVDRPGIGRPAERLHCPRGHAYTPANTIVRLKPSGEIKNRQCRTCRADLQRARRSAAKEARS